jgi:dihydrolipoamide dehydrogenase
MTDAPYDVCILGAGPGGYAAAMRAHDLGKRVALVERGRLGGAGLHDGALSSKTLWHLSNDYACACRADRGFRARGVDLSFHAVMESVREAANERAAILSEQLERLARASHNGGSVTLLRGEAAFVSAHEVEVRPVPSVPGSVREPLLVRADRFVVATGSRPRVPPGIEIDGRIVLTSDQIEHVTDFPESMVIVGAGVIGCEYATIFGNFGRTRINVIDRAPRILPNEDPDVAEVIAQSFERLGILIHHGAQLEELRAEGGRVRYTITNGAGEKEVFEVERALVSVGRAPNLERLGLDKAGVRLTPQGYVEMNGAASSQPHIYAAGDVTMDIALANVAELEGRWCVEHMFGLEPQPIRYEALSAIMFLSPEVASVGLNEQQAQKKKVPYRAAVLSNRLVNRNIAMRSTAGFVKLLATREKPYRLLGLRVVGPQASSAIQGVAYLIDKGATLEDIDRCMHPHPAITEGVQECARALLGRSVHKAEVFGERLLRVGEGA